jgi:hypothetical protein
LNIHQAYIQWNAAEMLQILAGRMVLSYGDELVLGGLEWNNTGRAFEALRLKFKTGLGSTDVIASKLQDNNITGNGNGDYDMYALYNSFDFGDAFKNVDLYFLYLTNGNAPTNTYQNAWHLGARLKSTIDLFDYRVEGGFQNTTVTGGTSSYAVDGEFGYMLHGDSKTRLSAGGFLASEFYGHLFPTWHKWLGIADVVGRQNVWGFLVRLASKPFGKWTFNLDFHKFYRSATTTSAFKANGTALGTAGGSASNDLGMEFDLVAGLDINETFNWQFGAGYMIPGAYLTDQFGTTLKPFFAYTAAQVKF